MNRNFYKQKLIEIQKLMNTDFKKALVEIDYELKMPYVPENFEKELIILKNKITSENNLNEKKQNISSQDAMEMLFDDENNQIIALSYLNSVNLREYKNDITKRIDTWGKKDHYKKVVLFEMLVDQEIDINLKINNKVVNPINNSIFNNKDINKIFVEIDRLTSQNPQERELCNQEANRYLINSFPSKITNFEEIAKTIFLYVSKLIKGDKNFSSLNQDILNVIEEKDKN